MPPKGPAKSCRFVSVCMSFKWIPDVKGLIQTMHKMPKFHLISWYGNFVERNSFRGASRDLPKTLPKLCLSTKFPYQGIKWHFGNLSSETYLFLETSECILCPFAHRCIGMIEPSWWRFDFVYTDIKINLSVDFEELTATWMCHLQWLRHSQN